MIEFDIDVLIDAPVGTTYRAYINPDNMPKYMNYLERIELAEGKFGDIGAKMKLHFTRSGRTRVMQDELLFLDPENVIKSKVSVPGLLAEVETRFYAHGTGSKIQLTWKGRGRNLLSILLLPLMKNIIKKQALGELKTFGKLVEICGEVFK